MVRANSGHPSLLDSGVAVAALRVSAMVAKPAAQAWNTGGDHTNPSLKAHSYDRQERVAIFHADGPGLCRPPSALLVPVCCPSPP
ncbi:hypothetical protein GCM10010840_26970 [Deinococcus aerolatus]|uniref:Uncharacterized protein n=1 Tax=Deinococcus aerolatus TaxID=522487 RepID=A0ABQ2GDL6_9DEIO|nr:hypothetical protein GCM10010840_26970 [Deinococcus aerolatus]